MTKQLTDADWDTLLEHISEGVCTPFLGSGACHGVLPLGGELSRNLATECGYPFDDTSNLARVAQYAATTYDPRHAKRIVLRKLAVNPPPVLAGDDPHTILADLPLPLYMTTNYDPLMFQALQLRKKSPKRELMRWNSLLKGESSVFDAVPPYELHPATPIVFHLHGHDGNPHSLVLTEDDYLEFLENMILDNQLLPRPIGLALQESSLLFIGYSLQDWNLRVLLRSLRQHFRSLGVIVMPPPPVNADQPDLQQKQQEYLTEHYRLINLKTYWGTAQVFCAELRRRYIAKFSAP